MESLDKEIPHGMDTTIYLVRKVATTPGSSSSKKTQREETESVRAEEKLVEKVHADSHRLRECSKYFEACMNERWARSRPVPSQLEFHLELQAGVVYYHDCFSRMEPGSLFQPIPSVDHCLELLKVASQIVFQEVVELGIKYISATAWSADDEVKIRRFCESGQISLDSEAHGDLIARLRMSSRKKTHGKMLSLYLEQGISIWADNRRVFEEIFQINLSGPNRHAVIEYVEKEATRLLLSFKESNDNIEGFAWLYGLLRSVHAGQSIVDLLLKNTDIFESIYERFKEVLRWEKYMREYMVWTRLIAAMLQDVLDGCLFLTSLERRTLFIGWRETCEISMGCSDAFLKDRDLRKLFTTFLMTFPFQEQMSVMESWNEASKFENVMSEVNGKWMMCLVDDLASRSGQEVTIAHSREPSDSAE